MKVAIIGSGGREHALARAVSKSNKLKKLFLLPGNPGTANLGINIPVNPDDHDKIVEFCKVEQIDLIVIGPEKPLIEGLSDLLVRNGFNVFGPSGDAARIEGEKSFAKDLMKRFNIPTASYEVFLKEDYDRVLDYLKTIKYPTVIKADGIAAGKGVVIAENYNDAVLAVNDCFLNSSFGNAGDKIVIEEFMTGQETSIFAITDGKEFILLPASQDHKRIFDGDQGKNTGGMGAFAPVPIVTEELLKIVSDKIVKPAIDAMRSTGSTYSGCLYCGLMLTNDGPKVVEFNCRFGDPETQVVLPLLDGDFLQLLMSVSKGKIDKESIRYNGGASVCVVAASKGYPDKYQKGIEIKGIDTALSDEIIIYHSGTKVIDGKLMTDGGRVLGVTSIISENDLSKAKQKAYQALSKIHFEGMQFRSDISDKAFQK